jgi:DNA-3-methyladenine glycosylase II
MNYNIGTLIMTNYLPLLKKDEKLTSILPEKGMRLEKRSNIALQLMLAIMSQQLSTQVARVFHQRFLALFPHGNPVPEEVMAIPYETLRSIGLSHAKATYVHHVAAYWVQEGITDDLLHAMDDAQVIECLTPIKGVGRWTVEMLLMFSLGREDVFPVDDLGIQQAMQRLYRLRPKDKKHLLRRLQQIANAWRPYRTYACLHLWAWKDGA